VSASIYWNQYTDLRTLDYTGNKATPYILGNREAGNTYGLEAWGDWRVLPWWKLSAGVNLMHEDLHVAPGSNAQDYSSGDNPGYQFILHSFMDLPHNVQFDFGFQVVDRLPDPIVEGYVQAEARIAWQVTPAIELSLAGNNLLAAYHVETAVAGTAPLEVQRSIYLGLRWKY
jgi:iron complex outermembrane receptor protein